MAKDKAKKKYKSSSLQSRLLRLSMLPMTLSAAIITIVAIITVTATYLVNYKDESVSLASAYGTAAQNLVDSLSRQFDVVIENPDIVNDAIAMNERKAILENRASTSTFKDFSVAYADGKTYNDTDISTRDYFINAMANKGTYVSSPVLRMTDNSLTVMMGKYFNANGQDYLVYGGLDTDTFNKIIEKVHFGENGICFIIDKNGQIIAASNTEVLPLLTVLGESEGYEAMGGLRSDMLTYTEGTGIINVHGTDYFVGYAPIEGAEGWSIAVGTPWASAVQTIVLDAALILGVAVVLMIAAIFIILNRTKNICVPIALTADRLTAFAEGDITSPAPTTKIGGEVQAMTDALAGMITSMQDWIGDIKNVLTSVSDGDLTAVTQADYKGDFIEIKSNLDMILESLNHVMAQVGRSASEVREGAVQLADGSSQLSQNAINQAAEVETITTTVLDIAKKAEENTANVRKALDTINTTNDQAQEGSRSMSDMLEAIREIEESSNEIEKIMKVIDDIAFQTNILALNAAIEAARAGDAGKGFAVVADEVRNLASKSADAAKETGTLIVRSIEAVNRGAALADTTSAALDGIVSGVAEVSGVMEGIAAASEEQEAGVGRISAGMDSVNTAIHNTSATAEESAAASEELSALAVTLSDEVSRFQCRE